MKNLNETFRSVLHSFVSGPISLASDSTKLSELTKELTNECDIFFKEYRSFINPKYKFAEKKTKAISNDFLELQKEFFNTLYYERFLSGMSLRPIDLDRVYWCISVADYMVLKRLLSHVWKIPQMKATYLSSEVQDYDTKIQYARYDYTVDIFNAMCNFAFDLQAHVGEQMRPNTYRTTTKWPFDFPDVAETLLLSVSLENSSTVHGKLRSHISSAVLIRSHLEAIAYRRDISSQMARIPEEITMGEPGEIYEKIKLLYDVIGSENVTYLRKTYDALNVAVHHGLNFSYGEVWIFLETVKRVGNLIEEKLREQGAFHMDFAPTKSDSEE